MSVLNYWVIKLFSAKGEYVGLGGDINSWGELTPMMFTSRKKARIAVRHAKKYFPEFTNKYKSCVCLAAIILDSGSVTHILKVK